MARHEYKRVMIRPSKFESEANELGQQHWKLIGMVDVDCFVFRRKIKKAKSTIPPDDVNPQLLSEDRPAQQVTQ